MTAIQIRKTAEEPGSASLAVTVPVEEVREAEERATTTYQQRARLPGFRRGKAPPALVRKHFAEDIRQETLQQLEGGAGAGDAAADRRPAHPQSQVGGGYPGHVRVPRRGEAGREARAHREVPLEAHGRAGHGRAGSGATERAARAESAVDARGG